MAGDVSGGRLDARPVCSAVAPSLGGRRDGRGAWDDRGGGTSEARGCERGTTEGRDFRELGGFDGSASVDCELGGVASVAAEGGALWARLSRSLPKRRRAATVRSSVGPKVRSARSRWRR